MINMQFNDVKIEKLFKKIDIDRDNISVFMQKMHLSTDKEILDVGCGPGSSSFFINKLYPGVKITGIDCESSFVNIANQYCKKNNIKNCIFKNGDCYSLPFADSTFDICFSRNMFHHLSSPMKAINEMIRVTKSTGYIGIESRDQGLTCIYPEPRHFSVYMKAEEKAKKIVSGDKYIGRKLYNLFITTECFKNIDVIKLNYDIVNPGREALIEEMYSDFMYEENISNHIFVKTNMMSEKEIHEYFIDLENIVKNSNSYVSYGSFFVYGIVNKLNN